MTDTEIIKALTEAIALMKRQKAEIDILIRKKDTLLDELAEQQADVENWKTLANEGKEKVELLEIEKSAMQHTIDMLNGSNSMDLPKVDHNSLCETETYKGGGSNG